MKNIADIITSFKPLTQCQRVATAVREAYLSATDYHDGGHYGALTDLTGVAALTQIRRKMLEDSTGSWILQNKPRITDEILTKLGQLPEQTLGYRYFSFMKRYNFLPSQRPIVQYVPDLQLAYVSQRYKQIHDFLHVLLLDEVNVHNELVVKWFQMVQLGLPAAAMAVVVSPLLSEKMSLEEVAKIVRLANSYKFVMNVYFEGQFERPLEEVRKEMIRKQ